jgi:phosphate transport system permease protein
MMSAYARRKMVNNVMLGGSVACAAACIGILFFIIAYVAVKGVGALNLDFFLKTPKPLGETGGGIANSIVGTAIMVAIATMVAVPIGIGAGIFLSEFASPRMGDAIRFTADVMTGFPSIVVGLFIYLVLVVRTGHFSGWAGGLALAVIMLPILARSAEEMLKLVPNSHREAAYALGVPKWRSIVSVVMPAAQRGLLTGALLAIARAAGESAPLLFTSLGSRFITTDPSQPMDALPLRIYRYATGPYDEWHAQAWAAALVLVLLVLVFSIVARTLLGREGGSTR